MLHISVCTAQYMLWPSVYLACHQPAKGIKLDFDKKLAIRLIQAIQQPAKIRAVLSAALS